MSVTPKAKMLKITEVRSKDGTVLMLEGRLVGPWVDELETYWISRTARLDGTSIQVNLKDVSYVDARGAHLLMNMERQGARLVAAPDFIWRLIGHDGNKNRRASGQRDPHES